MNGIASHIMLTSKDITSDIFQAVNACVHMHSDVTDSMALWDDEVHAQFIIVRFGTAGL